MNRIVYTCPYVPAEWIAACGLEPDRVIPRACAEHHALGRTEGLCAFAKAFTNEVLSNRDCRGAVFTTACDQMRRAYDIVETRANARTFLMNVPSTWQSAESKALYIDELKRLGKWFCTLGGQIPSNESLVAKMIEYDNERKSQCSLDSQRLHSNVIPLAIIGGPLLKSDFDIFRLVEKYGGKIILDATETGERTMPARFDADRLKDDPLSELATAYFQSIPAAWKRPNHQIFQWLGERCKQRSIKGIIYHRFVWCDIWHAELYRVKEHLGVPVLDLDVSDDSLSVGERTANRIQAFLETLQ